LSRDAGTRRGSACFAEVGQALVGTPQVRAVTAVVGRRQGRA
jgi:hypothetical protein